MADEITLNFRFDVINGSYRPGPISVSGLQINQALAGESGGVHIASTSDSAAISPGSLTDPGLLYMRNIQSTTSVGIVLWGFSTATMLGELRPDEFALIRTTTGASVHTIHTGAAGGARIQYRWLED